jgi:uncharacterized protein
MKEIFQHRAIVAQVCRELAVERLDLFGSAVRGELGPDSDIDAVARFDRRPGHMFSRYFDLKERLERIFNRPVDLLLDDAIQNPYLRKSIETSRVNLYGPGDEKISLSF